MTAEKRHRANCPFPVKTVTYQEYTGKNIVAQRLLNQFIKFKIPFHRILRQCNPLSFYDTDLHRFRFLIHFQPSISHSILVKSKQRHITTPDICLLAHGVIVKTFLIILKKTPFSGKSHNFTRFSDILHHTPCNVWCCYHQSADALNRIRYPENPQGTADKNPQQFSHFTFLPVNGNRFPGRT